MNVTTCDIFSSRSGFPEYINLLRNATNNDLSLIDTCASEVCGALWGTGNPDVSGIGMATGYILELMLALIIGLASTWHQYFGQSKEGRTSLVLANVSRTFYDTASLFTFSIQLACNVTIARSDLGLGAEGMGVTTKEIAWLVSSLTLLSLTPYLLRPSVFVEKKVEDAAAQPFLPQQDRLSSSGLDEARQDHRLYVFVVCWALAFYPFFSLMANTFGQSMIGDSQGSVMSNQEWEKVAAVCLDGIQFLTTPQQQLITASAIVSYLFTSLLVISNMIISVTKDPLSKVSGWLHKVNALFDEATLRGCISWLSVLSFTGVVLVVQFWAIIRFSRLQCDISQHSGSDCGDGKWSFGQIVAITVFLPVLSEAVFVWQEAKLNRG